MNRTPAFALASLLLFSGAASSFISVSAQETTKPQETLQYDVSVTLKLIQVYVTDKKGRPVPDLRLEDFVVTDNGWPMNLTEFERHIVGAPDADVSSGAAAQTLAETPVPKPQKMSRKFFLFFDFTYNNQRGILKSRQAALHFLETEVRPDDEVALMSFSMLKGVSFHEYLTTDHGKIREAVSAVNGKAIAGRAEDIEEEYWSTVSEALPMDNDWTGPVALNPSYFSWRRQESKDVVQSYIRRLTDLAKALRLVPGQKHFIFFSSGIPASMIYVNQVGMPAQPRGAHKFDTGDYVLRTANENLLKEFSASNCTVYAFDTRESAKVPALFDYDERTLGSYSRNVFSDLGVFQSTNDIFRDERTTGLDTLKRLSDITGGKYYGNINMYEKNLAQVQNLTGAYYVLGYAIGAEWDGRYHEVRVRVQRSGCEVRAQSGYFNPKPFREYTDFEKQLQLFDLALNERSDLGAPKTLPLAALNYDTGAGARLEVVSRIAASALGDSPGKNVELVLVTFDESGNLADLQRARFDFTRQPGGEFLFSAGVAVAPGDYRCRLVARDLDTGACAVGSTEARCGAGSGGLVLYSPLLLVPQSRTAYLEVTCAATAAAPGWRDAYPFDRTRYCPALGSVTRPASRVQVLVPYSVAGLADPQVKLSAYLIDAGTGGRQPVSFYLQGRSQLGTSEIQLLEFALERVPPGAYHLYIHAEEGSSRARAHSRLRIVVR